MIKLTTHKFGFMLFYALIFSVAYFLAQTLLDPLIAELIGYTVVLVFSYKFRLNRGDLRRVYVGHAGNADGRMRFSAELSYMVRFDEYMPNSLLD